MLFQMKSIIEQCQDAVFWMDMLSLSNRECRTWIEKMADTYHHPFAFKEKQSTIYVLWVDGEITEETLPSSTQWLPFIRRWIGVRDIKTICPPLFSKTFFCFPYSRYPYTGCVMTLEECRIFRAFIFRLYMHRSAKFIL